MTDIQMQENFDRLIELIKTNVTRDGVNNLINWLIYKTDLKVAPASTKYHNSFKGGLVVHLLNVYDRLNKILESEYPKMVADENGEMKTSDIECPYSAETVALVALFHDLSKVNFYNIQERNTKDESGNWIKVPYYSVKEDSERLIFDSHPINSYYMLTKFIKLSYEEELAIIHHEGAFQSEIGNMAKSNVMSAWRKSPLGMYLHHADMLATILDEGDDE